MTGGAGDSGRAPNRVHMSVPAMNRKPPKFPLRFRAPRCKAFLKGDRAEFAGFALDSATANERRRPSGPQCLHGIHCGRLPHAARIDLDGLNCSHERDSIGPRNTRVGCRDGEGPGEDGLSRGRAVRGLAPRNEQAFPRACREIKSQPGVLEWDGGIKGHLAAEGHISASAQLAPQFVIALPGTNGAACSFRHISSRPW